MLFRSNQITVGAVVQVLDLAKQNGADRVSLLKRAEEPAEDKGSAS